jgi:hypothetical protein
MFGEQKTADLRDATATQATFLQVVGESVPVSQRKRYPLHSKILGYKGVNKTTIHIHVLNQGGHYIHCPVHGL